MRYTGHLGIVAEHNAMTARVTFEWWFYPTSLCKAVRIRTVALVVLAGIGCAGSDLEWIEHPIADSLASASSLVGVIRADAHDEAPENLVFAARELATLKPSATIGTLDGAKGYVIGQIEDAVLVADGTVDAGGAVVALDGRFNEIKVYDIDGTFRSAIGGPGRGPGELAIPKGLTRDTRGIVYVADENLEIHRFDSTKDGWPFIDKIFTEFLAFDICALGSDLYVLGVKATVPDVVHRFDSAGAYRESFGRPYRTGAIDVRYSLSEGKILCDEERHQVVVGFTRLPEIHAYGSDGELRWISRIRGFSPPAVLEHVEGRRFRVGLPDDRDVMHQLVSIARLGHSSIVLQVGKYTRAAWEARKSFEQVESYVVDLTRGIGEGFEGELPLIADARDQYVLGYANDPFPKLTVYTVSR